MEIKTMYYLDKQKGEIEYLENCQKDFIPTGHDSENTEVIFYKNRLESKWLWKRSENCYPSWIKAFNTYRDFIEDEKRSLDLKLQFLKVKGTDAGYFEIESRIKKES